MKERMCADCGYEWSNGEYGRHSCAKYFRERIAEIERESTMHQKETDRWKSIAVYLADCHAANLHIAELKKTSKGERGRLKSIMDTARRMMQGLEVPRRPIGSKRSTEDVIRRLEEGIKEIEKL